MHDAGQLEVASAVRRRGGTRSDERHRGELRHEDGADRDRIARTDRERREPRDLRDAGDRTTSGTRRPRQRQAARAAASGIATPKTPISRAGTSDPDDRHLGPDPAGREEPEAERGARRAGRQQRRAAGRRRLEIDATSPGHDRRQHDADDDDGEGQRQRPTESGSPASTAKTAAIAPSVDVIVATMPTLPYAQRDELEEQADDVAGADEGQPDNVPAVNVTGRPKSATAGTTIATPTSMTQARTTNGAEHAASPAK